MTRSARVVALLVLALAVPAAARQSQPRADAGAIRGRVFAVRTGLPIANATVRLNGRELRKAAAADDEGYFEFEDVPPGDYLLSAVAAGYAIGAHGQGAPSEAPVSFRLNPRQSRDQSDIQLTPLGKIAGQIVEQDGRPAAGVGISVVRMSRSVGAEPRTAGRATAATGTTTASGAYAIEGLPAGSYYVIARRARGAPAAGRPALPAMFDLDAWTLFPGTTLLEAAQPVRVELGGDVVDVSFALQPVRLAAIAGTVVDTLGRPADDGVVLLNPSWQDLLVESDNVRFSEVAADGGFRLRDVPPGVYSLAVWSKSAFEAIARSGGTGVGDVRRGSREFANQLVRVAGDDIENLLVRTQPGFTVSGTVIADSAVAQRLGGFEIAATSMADTAVISRALLSDVAAVRADGSFEFRQLIGPQLIRVSKLPSGWMVKRISVAGLDVTDQALDVVHNWSDVEVTIARQTELAGRVTERRGLPIPGATVVVFAEDPRRWALPFSRFVQTAMSNEAAAFTMTGLPAGRYYAAALPAVVEGTRSEPADLEALIPRATRVSLRDGERRALDLRME